MAELFLLRLLLALFLSYIRCRTPIYRWSQGPARSVFSAEFCCKCFQSYGVTLSFEALPMRASLCGIDPKNHKKKWNRQLRGIQLSIALT